MNPIEHPKVFISYAWGSKEYQMKVLSFATALKADGIDVVIDKWNVIAGNDLNSFMEKSVSDPEITNVLILLDENYTKKADERQGGVGTETQILSQKVYESVEQSKFIPIVFERNSKGEICKPVYLQGRFHFDLSDDERYDEEYKNLVKMLYGVDTYKVPELGKKPLWVNEQISVSARSIAMYDSLKETVPDTMKYERLESFLNQLQERIMDTLKQSIPSNSFEDYLKHYELTKNIRADYLLLLSKSIWVDSYMEYIADFFESTSNKLFVHHGRETEIARIFLHELFIYSVAFYAKKKAFAEVGYLLGRTYFRETSGFDSQKGESFVMFYTGSDHSNLDAAVKKRDNKNYISGTATYWLENLDTTVISKREFTFADLLCFNYSVYGKDYLSNYEWFPITYIYENEYNNSISNLAKKLSSKEKLQQILPLFNYTESESFVAKFRDVEENLIEGKYRDYRYPSSFDSAPLLGFFVKSDELGSVR